MIESFRTRRARAGRGGSGGDVLLQQGEERLHRRIAACSADPAHRPDKPFGPPSASICGGNRIAILDPNAACSRPRSSVHRVGRRPSGDAGPLSASTSSRASLLHTRVAPTATTSSRNSLGFAVSMVTSFQQPPRGHSSGVNQPHFRPKKRISRSLVGYSRGGRGGPPSHFTMCRSRRAAHSVRRLNCGPVGSSSLVVGQAPRPVHHAGVGLARAGQGHRRTGELQRFARLEHGEPGALEEPGLVAGDVAELADRLAGHRHAVAQLQRDETQASSAPALVHGQMVQAQGQQPVGSRRPAGIPGRPASAPACWKSSPDHSRPGAME